MLLVTSWRQSILGAKWRCKNLTIGRDNISPDVQILGIDLSPVGEKFEPPTTLPGCSKCSRWLLHFDFSIFLVQSFPLCCLDHHHQLIKCQPSVVRHVNTVLVNVIWNSRQRALFPWCLFLTMFIFIYIITINIVWQTLYTVLYCVRVTSYVLSYHLHMNHPCLFPQ